jgi:hypothetical protein
VVQTLNELLKAREVCKGEIYEITGFSDIVRGVSKASETLGAQNIKANWAGARVKKMQKEVQRFLRDLIAIAGEVVAEHLQPASLALFGGIDIPSPEEAQTEEAQAVFARFEAAAALLKSEGRRCAHVDIETDSTILADEEAERKDRTDFLGAAGAFLQQAVPAMQATPELGPLLGAMLMFVVRTFPSSRPIEEEFEKVQKALAARPPAKPDDDGSAGKAQAAKEVAGIRANADVQKGQQQAQVQQMQMAADERAATMEIDVRRQAEDNRHMERMAEIDLKRTELALREREVRVKEMELGIKEDAQQLAEQTAAHDAAMSEVSHEQEDTRMQMDHEAKVREGSLTGDEN